MSTVERRVERFLQGGQSAFQLMSVENSRVMKEETRIRKSVELSLLLLKLRSLGWRSWSVTLTWPKSLTFCKSYDLRKRKHLKLSTYSLRQELGKLRPQLGCLTDILSDTMSNQVLQNGGQATTINQCASSRSSLAASRVLHSSNYVTLYNSRSKSKDGFLQFDSPFIVRTSTHKSQIADALLSRDVVPIVTKY